MTAASMVFMYGLMYLHTLELAHVRWSETHFFMTLLIGSDDGTHHALVILGMYLNWRINVAIVAASLLLFGLGTWLNEPTHPTNP